MRKFFVGLLALMVTASVFAVPARRGWQTRTQADGTQIEIQVIGDEFYHYMINRDGKQVREINGMYVEVGEAPTPEQAKARHAKAAARRQRKAVGVTPNLAPKGVVILANYSDVKIKSANTLAVFDELCNSTNCTVNKYNGKNYPSAAQFFADQSNGSYRPKFDVYGPVTLSRDLDYYGHNIDLYTGQPTDESDPTTTTDQYATDAVVEACLEANLKYNINWADYDSDNDGYLDFVYVIYAGKGEADGGAANTIWPHNWEVEDAISSGSCSFKADTCVVGGKKINNYACSGELSSNGGLSGIGTLCHEFGHVIGLPDLYDTSYGNVYNYSLSPADWNIMDGGSYNADGHCPPNYDPWQKDFFGWHTPINLGSEGQYVTLYANGTANYQAYQITTSGSYVSPTTEGVRYYIENRQAQGWDAPLTGHGMLLWKVNFRASAWKSNSPNESTTSGAPLHSIVSAYGTAIGWDGYTDNCPKNTFPGTGSKTSYDGISGKPLLNIAESANGVVTLTYIEKPANPVTCTWMANGEQFTQTTGNGKVVLPENKPADCESGKVFVGWTKQSSITDGAKPTDLFTTGGQAVTEPTTFYAVYASQEGEGGAAFDGTTGGTFKIYADIDGTKYYATSVSNNKLQSTTKESEATDFTFTAVEGGFTIKNGTKYIRYGGSQANISSTTSTYTWKIEDGSHGTWRVNATTGTNRALVFRTKNSTTDYYVFGGYTTGNINGTEYFDLEIGNEGSATYSDYSLECGAVVVCELTGITLNTDNVQKEFTIGDDFNSNGLTVTAQFSNCAEKNVTDFIVEKPEMAFAGTKTVTVSYTFDGVTKTASYEIEVKEPEVYTIRFFNNGEQVGQDQLITEGQQPDVPADPEAACEKYTFAGWAKAAVTTETETKPDLVTDFTAIQDQDYFAVFSRTETEEGDPTGASAAFDGQTPGTYKIFGIAGGTNYYATASINSNAKLETKTTEADAAEFDFEAVEGGFTIKTGGKYLKYNGSSTNIGLGTDPYTWSISASESGKGSWRIIASSATNRALILRVTSDFQSFGAYVTTNVTATGTEYFDVEIEGEGGPKSKTYYTTAPECDDPVVCELLEIELDLTNVQTSFVINEEFNHNGLAVTAHYGNCNDKQITDFEVTAPDDMSSEGEKEVVVSYTENGITKTSSYFISVTAPQTFTIRFFDNGEQVGQDQLITEGQQPQVPADPEAACEKYTFAGWATDDVEETTTKPDLVTDFTAIQDQDYFAVFSRTETTEGEGSGAYIIFKTVETDKTTALDPEGIAAFIESESGIDSYYGDRIYEGQYGLKFSTSRYTGSLNIGLVEEITTNTITLETHTYGTDATTFTIKTELDQYTFGEAQTVKDGTMTFTTENPMTFSQLSITTNSKKRAYIKSITIGEGGASSTTYYTSFENCSEEAIEEIVSGNKAVKVLENGMIIIIRDGAQYTIFGQKIK